MRILVTGATGFVGREILRQLSLKEHSVRILARHSTAPGVRHAAQKVSLEVHEGDVTKVSSLVGALDDVQAVIHLVGIISEVGASTFETVHAQGTRNLIEAARKAGVERFVHMSALGTRPNAVARYHQTKWLAEESVRNSGLAFTIFRPSLIFGPGDHFVRMMVSLSRFSPILPVIGNGQARFQPVGVQAVASAFAQAAASSLAEGRTLDLCGPETLTFEQMLEAILRVLGRRRAKWHVPLGLARIQARALEWLFPQLLRRAPPLNRDQILMLQEDNVGNGSEADALFHLPKIRFEEGLTGYLKP